MAHEHDDTTPDNQPRRFGRRDRKDQLARPRSPIPPDDTPDSDAETGPLPFDDLPDDRDADDLAALQQLAGDTVRPLAITPPEERFPPLNPQPDTTPQIAAPKLKIDPAQHQRNRHYNRLSLAFLLGTLGLIAFYTLIWLNPLSPLNPFPPQVPVVYVTATLPVSGVAPTPNTDDDLPLSLAGGGVQYQANTNSMGCAWASIAGRITNASGDPLTGYRVQVRGAALNATAFSGTELAFGESGYEVMIADRPQSLTYSVQVFNTSDEPLSPPVDVTLRPSCDANVAVVPFVQE